MFTLLRDSRRSIGPVSSEADFLEKGWLVFSVKRSGGQGGGDLSPMGMSVRRKRIEKEAYRALAGICIN
jgi:hypothetical protein